MRLDSGEFGSWLAEINSTYDIDALLATYDCRPHFDFMLQAGAWSGMTNPHSFEIPDEEPYEQPRAPAVEEITKDNVVEKIMVKDACVVDAVLALLHHPGPDFESQLFDTLGFESLEVVQYILAHPKYVSDKLSEQYRKSREITLVQKAPVYGPTVTILDKKKKGPRVTTEMDRQTMFMANLQQRSKEAAKQKDVNTIINEIKSTETFLKTLPVTYLRGSEAPKDVEGINWEWDYVDIPGNEPPPLQAKDLVKIDEFDELSRLAFQGITKLNRIQSAVFEVAYKTNENMLICAPTGAGKTLIALMTMLHLIQQHYTGGLLRKEEFKIVYVAPMKALAAEMTANFGKRLQPFGIVVSEWTGDMQLTKKQVTETNVFVTTPEKWDTVTRKSPDDSLIKLVRLLIIDEVHLLHDERGPVIEMLVARTLRQVESTQSMIRVVGLSATLPNYGDVGKFLGVNQNGLFVFDSSFRPVRLDQLFIGVKEVKLPAKPPPKPGAPPPPKKASDKYNADRAFNDITFRYAMKSIREGHQVMIFVHSRKSTVTTGEAMLDLAAKRASNDLFVSKDIPTYMNKEINRSLNQDLKKLLPRGIGCHHAGMLRQDRTLVERLFKDGGINLIVCTATLAWGVNLPAHTVIIKGTTVYSTTEGKFSLLGILDVMQIFGRAGRPQFDTSGQGIIITEQENLVHYIQMLTQALPIESKFQDAIEDHLNAEIVLGNVANVTEAIRWLGYSYLYVRMLRSPTTYGMNWDVLRDDRTLGGKRHDLVVQAARELDAVKMVRFDEETNLMSHTELGRIASHYYISHKTVEMWVEPYFHEAMTTQEALNLVSMSREFGNIKSRDEESKELKDIYNGVLYTIREKGLDEEEVEKMQDHDKVNALLQAYISNTKVDTFSLISDTNFIIQSAGRITRALFEVCLGRCWLTSSHVFLHLSIGIEKRIWPVQHPLRQFPQIRPEICSKLEAKKASLHTLQDMEAGDIGRLIHDNRWGPTIKEYAERFPKLHLECKCQPITANILRVQLSILPQFKWHDTLHGSVQPFFIFVEDNDNNVIIHHEHFLLTKRQFKKQDIHQLNFTIPINEPIPAQYYIRVSSERFYGVEETLPISLHHIILPSTHPPYTDLLPLQPLPVTALNWEPFFALYKFSHFNPIQTQIFHTIYYSDVNILVGAPTGSGKTIAAEFAVLRVLREYEGQKIIYIAPLKALVKERLDDWTKRFQGILGKTVVEMTGDAQPDIGLLNSADILLTTPEKWDGISRNWQNRGYVRDVALVIIDEIHLLGGDRGPILEVIVSRMRYIGWNTGKAIRILGLSTALSNAHDLAAWMGIDKRGLYNFKACHRPVPCEVHIQGYPGKHYCPRMATMNRPTYNAIMQHSPAKPALIFVSSRRQTRLTALDLISFLAADSREKHFLNMTEEELELTVDRIADDHLKHTVSFGIGLHHAGLSTTDKTLVEKLFLQEKIRVLVATATLAWGVNLPAHLVVVKGTEFYDGKTKTYIDMPITDVLQMIGRAGRPQFDKEAKAVVLVHEPKKGFYKKFLYDPFPVESSLHVTLHEHMNAEIVSGTISKRQDAVDYLTWTYLFRRIVQNPTYYGVENVSHESVTVFLSRLVERCLRDLQSTQCIECEGDELVPTVIGRIASYYYLSHQSASMFDRSIKAETDMQSLLQMMCDASEFNELPVRHNEDKLNADLARTVPWPVDTRSLDDPHTKANLLFQAHFSRGRLPISDYLTDTKSVLDNAIRIVQAMVDITANNGHLFTTLKCMSLLQMIMQGRWYYDNTLLQLPHTTVDHLPTFADNGLTCLAHAAHANRSELHRVVEACHKEKTDEELKKILKDTFDAVNAYPRVDVVLGKKVEWPEKDEGDDEAPMAEITLEIELIRRSRVAKVYSTRYSKAKDDGWWVVIGDPARNDLVAVKRVNFRKRTKTQLVFDWDEEVYGAAYEFTFYLICDSYIGMDQQYTFTVQTSEFPPPPAPKPDLISAPVVEEEGDGVD